MPTPSFLECKPLVITALHLPELRLGLTPVSICWLEDYVCQNMQVFSDGGIPAVILQEETLNSSLARPESVAVVSVLARLARMEFPHIHIGIIIQAHDPIAPLAIAHASGAEFVRIKVFVGAMVKSEGIHQGCGIEARDYRTQIGNEQIKILADVHDRTGTPLTPEPIEMAAEWAVRTGADSLVLTGSSEEESLHYLKVVREAGIDVPLMMGGGATCDNVSEMLKFADGVIVSSALKRSNADPQELVQWDLEKVKRFMEAARK